MADEFSSGVAPEAPDPVQQVKDTALTQMARSEDATDYIAERQDQQREEAGEQVNGEERVSRIRQALEQARADTQQARQQNGLDQPPPDLNLDQQLQSAEQEWSQAQAAEQEAETEREAAKLEGRFTAHAEALKTSNPLLGSLNSRFAHQRS